MSDMKQLCINVYVYVYQLLLALVPLALATRADLTCIFLVDWQQASWLLYLAARMRST